MTARLLLDEHYSEEIAAALRALGHDVVAVVSNPTYELPAMLPSSGGPPSPAAESSPRTSRTSGRC